LPRIHHIFPEEKKGKGIRFASISFVGKEERRRKGEKTHPEQRGEKEEVGPPSPLLSPKGKGTKLQKGESRLSLSSGWKAFFFHYLKKRKGGEKGRPTLIR